MTNNGLKLLILACSDVFSFGEVYHWEQIIKSCLVNANNQLSMAGMITDLGTKTVVEK